MRFHFATHFLVGLTSLIFLPAIPLHAQATVVHQRLSSAHAVFLGNAGGADNATNERAYEAIALSLQKINRYTIVDSSEKADLVIEVHLDPDEIIQNGNALPDHKVRLVVSEPRSRQVIWTVSEKDVQPGITMNGRDKWSKFDKTAEKLSKDLL